MISIWVVNAFEGDREKFVFSGSLINGDFSFLRSNSLECEFGIIVRDKVEQTGVGKLAVRHTTTLGFQWTLTGDIVKNVPRKSFLLTTDSGCLDFWRGVISIEVSAFGSEVGLTNLLEPMPLVLKLQNGKFCNGTWIDLKASEGDAIQAGVMVLLTKGQSIVEIVSASVYVEGFDASLGFVSTLSTDGFPAL